MGEGEGPGAPMGLQDLLGALPALDPEGQYFPALIVPALELPLGEAGGEEGIHEPEQAAQVLAPVGDELLFQADGAVLSGRVHRTAPYELLLPAIRDRAAPLARVVGEEEGGDLVSLALVEDAVALPVGPDREAANPRGALGLPSRAQSVLAALIDAGLLRPHTGDADPGGEAAARRGTVVEGGEDGDLAGDGADGGAGLSAEIAGLGAVLDLVPQVEGRGASVGLPGQAGEGGHGFTAL